LPFALLLIIVEFDVTLENGNVRPVVGRSLLKLLLELLIFLLVGGCDYAPATPPRDTSTEPHPNPSLVLKPHSLHNDVDVVERLSLSGDESTGISFLQGSKLEHC